MIILIFFGIEGFYLFNAVFLLCWGFYSSNLIIVLVNLYLLDTGLERILFY